MKKLISLLMAALFVLLTACGSSTPDAETGSAPAASVAEANEAASAAESGGALSKAQMLYFKKLDDSSIMAACDGEGIDLLGGDYYVVHVGDANIYNAQGEEITLDELVRGCELMIEWSGAVMESYPAQISVNVVRAVQDKDVLGIPEDELPALFGGPKWWEEDPVLEVPSMSVQYWTELAVVSMQIEAHSGTWRYVEAEYDNETVIGEENTMVDGQHPLDWTYDDSNTIKKQDVMLRNWGGLDTMTESELTETQSITIGPYPNTESLTVTAYTVDDDSREGVPVTLLDGGCIELPDKDTVYVVEASWNQERYQGSAVYSFLVTAD